MNLYAIYGTSLILFTGNVIASRTENLMKQYERDLQTEERKPVIDLTEGAEASEEEARKPEVQSIRMQYQRSLQEDVNGRRSSENEIKSRKSLGMLLVLFLFRGIKERGRDVD